MFARGSARGQLVLEGELALAPAFTGTMIGGRGSYFAPVFGWRAHALLRVAAPVVQPHLLVGGGGETVASSSPFMTKESDPVGYWGAGASVPVSGRWLVRVDVRHGLMPDRGDGVTSTLEVQLGFATAFGGAPAPRPAARARPVDDAPVVVDGDGDGIADPRDACPAAAETVNAIDDADGCPEADDDGDGVVGTADRCLDAAEDRDGFADGDGCPDVDDDVDAIADAVDRCPREPEVPNGIEDTDGCPDVVPDAVTRALARAGTLAFPAASARVSRAASKALAPLVAALRAHRDLRVVIVAHPATAASLALARRRADAVKWHLVDAGVETARLAVEVGAAGARPIEVRLAPPATVP